MRIIAGSHRGRRLHSPTGDGVRPTSDRLRQRLFNIIEHGDFPALAGARVADLFAGSGAMGLEALSRGAGLALFVEKHDTTLIARNIAALDLGSRTRILKADARALPPQPEPMDFIFMDPPYGQDLVAGALRSLMQGHWIGPETALLIEEDRSTAIAVPDFLTAIDSREQGKTRVLILKRAD